MSKSNKYVRGKIYKLVCNKTDLVYVGSTCEARLCRRLAGHVSKYKSYINSNGCYVSSFRIIENGDYQILLLEECPCESKDQLKAKEAKYICEMDCVNINIPGRTQKQYRDANKDKAKEYYHKNQDKIKKHKEVYYKKNKDRLSQINYCECGMKYITKHKNRHEKTKKHQEYLQGDWIYIWE
jgi:hypothetical protein